jgi:uncharacterized membrane protein YccC
MSALPEAFALARDAAEGLRHELSEIKPTGPRSRQNAATALSVGLGVVLALWLHVDSAWWAAISAFVSSQTNAPASVHRGILRILGTSLGAGVTVLLAPWLGEDTVALSLALFAASALGVLGFLVSGHGYAFLLGAITADMVLMATLGDPGSALFTGVNRTAEVTLGTVAAMLVAVLMAPEAGTGPPGPGAGWSDLTGAQWPCVRHALQAGVGVLLVPLVWNLLALPSLSQTGVTVAAVMAVPTLSGDAQTDHRKVVERAMQRILGCLLGGVAGLTCLALSIDAFLPWLLMLMAGIWICAHIQASERGIGYVGTQGAIVFISTLMQGLGPPDSILPGIERLAGIAGGLLLLLGVMVMTAPSDEPAEPEKMRSL